MDESKKFGLIIFIIFFFLSAVMLFVSGVCFTCKDVSADGGWSFFPDGSRFAFERTPFCLSNLDSPCPLSLFILFAIFSIGVFVVLFKIIKKNFFSKKM